MFRLSFNSRPVLRLSIFSFLVTESASFRRGPTARPRHYKTLVARPGRQLSERKYPLHRIICNVALRALFIFDCNPREFMNNPVLLRGAMKFSSACGRACARAWGDDEGEEERGRGGRNGETTSGGGGGIRTRQRPKYRPETRHTGGGRTHRRITFRGVAWRGGGGGWWSSGQPGCRARGNKLLDYSPEVCRLSEPPRANGPSLRGPSRGSGTRAGRDDGTRRPSSCSTRKEAEEEEKEKKLAGQMSGGRRKHGGGLNKEHRDLTRKNNEGQRVHEPKTKGEIYDASENALLSLSTLA